MARTTTAKNQMGTFNAQGNQGFQGAESEIAQYNANQAKLRSGGNVGANPFLSTPYLSNVNKLQSEALNTNAESGKAAMRRWDTATGGLNRSQVPLAQRDIGLQTGRLADTLSAERAANDYKANLGWQQYLAGAPLAGAGINAGLYSTATGGSGNALNDYTNAADSTWSTLMSPIDAAVQGGSAAMMAKALNG